MKRLEYKWLVAIVLIVGLFMDILDATIVNVAIPTFGEEFNAPPTTIEWVVSGYLLSLAVVIPLSGWAGDRFGTKRVFLFALTVFTLSSGLCALAWNIESLIAFRVLQGVGGGMMTPVATAMMFRAFPPAERARASAFITIPIVFAPATGPVLGGYLVEYHSWHWIFLVNLPIGLLGIVLAATLLREEKQFSPGAFDIPGFVLSATGFTSAVYALAEAGQYGFGDTRVILFGIAGIALLAAFVVVELRVPHPMIDMRLFKDRLFAAGNTVMMFGTSGFIGALFVLPLMLQIEKGLSPLESGLTTFPQAFGFMAGSQPALRLYHRFGPRRCIMAASIGVALTSVAFMQVGETTDSWWIRGIMFFRGCSMSLLFIPLQTATFATITPAMTGRASAIYNINRQVASSIGVALLATILTSRLQAHGAILGNPETRAQAFQAFSDVFLASVFLALLGGAVAWLINDKLAAGTMRARDVPAGSTGEAAAVH